MTENKDIVDLFIGYYKKLMSIIEHNPTPEAIEEWKSKVLPKLEGTSKTKISRLKIVEYPVNSYSFSMDIDEHELAIAKTVLRDTVFKYSNKGSKEGIEALKILKARENNIEFEDELAEMIYGQGDNFPHRYGDQLTKFFKDLGYSSVNENYTSMDWVTAQLEELNIKEIHTLISKGLFRKKAFTNVEHTQYNMYVSYEKAIQEFKNFIQESIIASESLDLGLVLDMNVNIELLFDNKANTEDSTLNDLIKEAKERYLNNDKQVALEKLWDAYERIKTIFTSEGLNKKLSAIKLSELISENFEEDFINEEFQRLTNIGNGYRIRHHETGKRELTPEHENYFFFRLLSFIDLCLVFLNKHGEPDNDLFND